MPRLMRPALPASRRKQGVYAAILMGSGIICLLSEIMLCRTIIFSIFWEIGVFGYKVFPLLFYYLAGRSDTLSDGLDDVYCGGAGC